MKWNKLWMVLLFPVLLVSCAKQTAELPDPQTLFEELQQKTELPEMVDLAEELLLDSTGIAEESYDSAVCFLPSEGIGPEEIIIVKARDDGTAKDIQEKLEARLDYKEAAAQIYLTEYMPLIQEGVVRRDGLTVSLIVSEKTEEIVRIYNQYQ